MAGCCQLSPTLVLYATYYSLLVACSICLGVQIRQESTGDREASTKTDPLYRRNTESQFVFTEAHESFVSTLSEALDRLGSSHRPLLIHTRYQEATDTEMTDALVFVRRNNENFSVSINVPTYTNIQAISHLPVSVVTVVVPEVAPNGSISLDDGARRQLQDLLRVLDQSAELIQPGVFQSEEQAARQTEIVALSSQFVRDILDGDSPLNLQSLTTFSQSLDTQLRENARDAVRDYLICLNETISILLEGQIISATEWLELSVVVALEPFAHPGSFLTQYYQQLLATPETTGDGTLQRVVFLSSTFNANTTISSSIEVESNTTLNHNISQLFYGSDTPIHDILSRAALDVICSNELLFPSCTSTEALEHLPPGFETRVQRIYVIVIIYIGTLAVVLGTILACVCSEGQKMKRERRAEVRELRMRKGPNVFSPVEQIRGLDETSNLKKRGRSASDTSVQSGRRSKEVNYSEVTL